MIRIISDRYLKMLESVRAEQRQDFEKRIAEKDFLIRQLRMQVGKLESERERTQAEKPAPNVHASTFTPPPDWDGELKKLLQEEDDGIRSTGREEVHEPRPDDVA